MRLSEVNNIQLEIITVIDTPTNLEKDSIAEFILNHQKEIKENKDGILKSIEFAFGLFQHSGGFVVLARDTKKMNNPIIGCSVVNQTSMSGYVSENLLVYLTVHNAYEHNVINKLLLEQTMHFAKGNIDVHAFLHDENKKLFIDSGFEHAYNLYRLNRK